MGDFSSSDEDRQASNLQNQLSVSKSLQRKTYYRRASRTNRSGTRERIYQQIVYEKIDLINLENFGETSTMKIYKEIKSVKIKTDIVRTVDSFTTGIGTTIKNEEKDLVDKSNNNVESGENVSVDEDAYVPPKREWARLERQPNFPDDECIQESCVDTNERPEKRDIIKIEKEDEDDYIPGRIKRRRNAFD